MNNPLITIRDVSETSRLFSIYNQETGEDEELKLTEKQREIYNAIATRAYPRFQCISYTQYGKKLADSVPVITTNGWKNHGELNVGDYVFNPDGNPVKVIDTLNNGKDIEYEIEFSDGEVIQCHAEHEWLVAYDNWKMGGNPYRILETQQILDLDYKKVSLPFVSPLKFEKKDLPIDPYFFGAWLGDGTSTSPVITGVDKEVIDGVPYSVTSKSIHKKTGVTRYYFGRSEISNNLRKLGVYKNKHIPDIYKYSSIEQRLQLLAGMIDTDGTVNKDTRENGWRNSRVYFININKRLVDDFVEVVNGLGIRTSITKVNACVSSSGIYGKSDTYYVGFQPFIKIPTRIKRKQITALEKLRRLRIRDIRKIEPVNGKCITVDGGMYLAGKKLIPTHNSNTVAAAVTARVATHPEKWALVAPSQPKAMIIMRNIFQFCAKSKMFGSELEMEEDQKKSERLLRETSKKRIVFKNGGEIFLLSADNRNKAAAGETLMGFGAPNVIIDESSLIDDDIYGKIKRMLGGTKNNFLFEIGNPFKRNHFLRTWHDDEYYKIFIDWRQGVKEGRISQKFVDEMRKEFDFDVMYECKFPKEESVDSDGWSILFSEVDVENAFRDNEINQYGDRRLGVDIARSGGNYNVWVLRSGNHAEIVGRTTTNNLMEVIGTTKDLADRFNITDNNIFIDATGMGAGVYDRFRETNWYVRGVNLAEASANKERFINIRAEAYIRSQEWLKKGGTLNNDSGWLELCNIRYKTRSNGKIQIISKEELRDRNIKSPDIADAFMLTFITPDENKFTNYNKINEQKRQNQPVYE
jgi:hypothetical protein